MNKYHEKMFVMFFNLQVRKSHGRVIPKYYFYDYCIHQNNASLSLSGKFNMLVKKTKALSFKKNCLSSMGFKNIKKQNKKLNYYHRKKTKINQWPMVFKAEIVNSSREKKDRRSRKNKWLTFVVHKIEK